MQKKRIIFVLIITIVICANFNTISNAVTMRFDNSNEKVDIYFYKEDKSIKNKVIYPANKNDYDHLDEALEDSMSEDDKNTLINQWLYRLEEGKLEKVTIGSILDNNPEIVKGFDESLMNSLTSSIYMAYFEKVDIEKNGENSVNTNKHEIYIDNKLFAEDDLICIRMDFAYYQNKDDTLKIDQKKNDIANIITMGRGDLTTMYALAQLKGKDDEEVVFSPDIMVGNKSYGEIRNLHLTVTYIKSSAATAEKNTNNNMGKEWKELKTLYDKFMFLKGCAQKQNWAPLDYITKSELETFLKDIKNDKDLADFKKTNQETYNTVVDMINYLIDMKKSGDKISSRREDMYHKFTKKIKKDIENATKELIAAIKAENRKEKDFFYDVFENLEEYDPTKTPTKGSPKAVSMASTVLSVITSIGIVLSVLIPAIVGVKYMFSSIEGKAEYKKDMIPYLVGAILLFGISTIVKVMQNIGQSINNM